MPYVIVALGSMFAGFVASHVTGKPTITVNGSEGNTSDAVKIGFYLLLGAAAWQIVKRVRRG